MRHVLRGFPLLCLAASLAFAALVAPARLAAQVPDSARIDSTRADTVRADTVRADSAGAADEDEDDRPVLPWHTDYLPSLDGAPNDGPALGFRVRYWRQADYEAPLTYSAAFTTEGGVAIHGSRFISARYHAPLLWDGWRLNVVAAARLDKRLGFFGLGNSTTKDEDLVTDDQPFLYRVRRTTYVGQAELTRRLKGPLQIAFLADVTHARFEAPDGPSVFQDELGDLVKQTDVSGRVALLYDTRDNQYNTHRGLFVESGVQRGSGGDGYTRVYAMARAYAQVRDGTVIAARLGGSGIDGTPSLNARFAIPTWEEATPVLGGVYSQRSLDEGRYAGTGVLLGNVEIRQDLLNFGDYGAVTLLGFVDAGRVFEDENFRLTTEDLKVGGGGGIGIRILRGTIFTITAAGGPDGFNLSFGQGWSF